MWGLSAAPQLEGEDKERGLEGLHAGLSGLNLDRQRGVAMLIRRDECSDNGLLSCIYVWYETGKERHICTVTVIIQ